MSQPVAFVTGCSSGIGRALADAFQRAGYRVWASARKEDDVRALAEAGFQAVQLDVNDAAALARLAEELEVEAAGLDVLVNNAGYGRHCRFADWDLDDIERMMQVNFLGSVYWTKAVLPWLSEQRQGWIVFMASVAGRIGVPDESAYAASKFAMVGLAESLSCEVEDAGVHVLTVCPGAIDTPFFRPEDLARMPAVAKRSMIGPERVVDATLSALARGRHEVTVPASIAVGYVVRALAPEFMRRQVKKTTIG